jgi:uncharacterized protein
MSVLVVTGGHPFQAGPWVELWDAVAADGGFEVEHVPQPDALERIAPGAEHIDAVVFYDMPGLTFTGDPSAPLKLTAPPDGYLDGLRQMLRDGIGMVFMHHAVASWPASEEFAELVGGRFHYQPGSLRGTAYPDSGYAFDITHTVEVLDAEHPICAGLPASFELTDELYRFPVFDDSVAPLMRTTYDVDGPGFSSADLAIRGERNSDRGWSHPPGSDLVAWTRDVEGGRLAYLQFGDGPVTYADPTFRTVLGNAVAWAVRG